MSYGYVDVSGLSAVDLRILTCLHAAYGTGGRLAAELAEAANVSTPGLGSRLRSLEGRNLIERQVVMGHRGRVWKLTADAYRSQKWRRVLGAASTVGSEGDDE